MKTTLSPIGHYELQQRLERKSIGEVWQAFDSQQRRAVALKFYRAGLPYDADELERYVRNVEQVAALHHPNILPIQDVHVLPSRSSSQSPDDANSLICLAMPFIHGKSLAEYLRSTSATRKIPPSSEVVELFTALALALDSTARRGIVHGNLKPTNILLDQSLGAANKIGTPLLSDFGVTRFQPERHGQDIPFYLSPEQIKGAPATERSDIYSLGVILYELYTGVLPFRGNRPIAVMMQHINAEPTPPELVNPTISPALSQVILRCLSKDPQMRFPHASLLVASLANALHVEVPYELRRSFAFLDEATAPGARQSASAPAVSARPQRRRPKLPMTVVATFVLVLLLSTGFGTFLLTRQLSQQTIGTNQPVGHAFFINSGQLNESSNQGINDELQVDLSNIPNPTAGKSYFAWLLGDISQTEASPIFLGRVPVEHGSVHFLYTGDAHHANLLGLTSRFLITEDDTHHPSSNPLLDQSTWRYYGAIPQAPSPTDKLHFSMLDHLRHLLVESPELAIRGLHGGLAFWFVKNSASVSNLANSLADEWHQQDAPAIHDQIIRILDYLDGASFVHTDVPDGTPLLVDAQAVQVALLGPAPQDADPPGYVFQNEAPPGYLYLIENHMNGAILTPQTTQEQRQLALQINGELDKVRSAASQVSQDARQLVKLTDTQLLQVSSLALLDDLAAQAQYAYTGRPNPAAGATQGGALWLYDNLQRLATFEVAPYTH